MGRIECRDCSHDFVEFESCGTLSCAEEGYSHDKMSVVLTRETALQLAKALTEWAEGQDDT